jgi:hypothetical protein
MRSTLCASSQGNRKAADEHCKGSSWEQEKVETPLHAAPSLTGTNPAPPPWSAETYAARCLPHLAGGPIVEANEVLRAHPKELAAINAVG